MNITDILYTYVIGKTSKAKDLHLISKDFRICVELPIKAKRMNCKLATSKLMKDQELEGKKVNAFKDGFMILMQMIKLFVIRN